jgi:hypothetical protein
VQPARRQWGGLFLFWGMAMEMIKALTLGAILSATIALVIGSQGSSGGALAIHMAHIADFKLYWSWPIFLSGSGLSFGLMLMQR